MQAAKTKTKTLVFVYYSGHGTAEGDVEYVLDTDRPHNMERWLKSRARLNGEYAYTLAIYDCCRESFLSFISGLYKD